MISEQDIDQRVFEHLRTFRHKFPALSADDLSLSDDVSQGSIVSIYNSPNPDIPSFMLTTHHNTYNDVTQVELKLI